jgi:hypothetical protein
LFHILLALFYVLLLTPRAYDSLKLPLAGREPAAYWIECRLLVHSLLWQIAIQSLAIGAYLTAVTMISGPPAAPSFPYVFAVLLVLDRLIVESLRFSTSFAVQALLAVAAIGFASDQRLFVLSFVTAAVCFVQRIEFIGIFVVLVFSPHCSFRWMLAGLAAAAAVCYAGDRTLGLPDIRTKMQIRRRLRELAATDWNLMMVAVIPTALFFGARSMNVPWRLVITISGAAVLVFVLPVESERDTQLSGVAVVRILAHVLCGAVAAKQKGAGAVAFTALAGFAVLCRIISTWRALGSLDNSFAI